MKNIVFLFAALFIWSASIGQAVEPSDMNSLPQQNGYDSASNNTHQPVVQKFNRMSQVIQSTGRVYSGDDIQHSAAKDLNQIVNTVPGVQYRPGESLIIRGVQGGAAYFVDGMRIYGALPIISR